MRYCAGEGRQAGLCNVMGVGDHGAVGGITDANASAVFEKVENNGFLQGHFCVKTKHFTQSHERCQRGE